MSLPRPPLWGVEGQRQCNVSSTSSECVAEKLGLYLGLSDSSSVDSCAVSNVAENSKSNSNLNATELRLGLPGSQSSDLSPRKHDEKQLFPLIPSKDGICSLSQKAVASGNKRGFADTVDTFSESKTIVLSEGNWTFSSAGFDSGKIKLSGDAGSNVMFFNRSPGTQSSVQTEVPAKTSNESNNNWNDPNSNSAPVPKAQVVGWPPIRSFRKNCVAATSKNSDGPSVLFVKVSMAGAPYLRKVDLKAYSTYGQLSSALEKMFTSFTSEYVLTYEDKDSDWMLVGDVPWEMFIASCRRLKIMKGPDAIGLGPRSRGVEKEKSKNRT